MITFINFDFKPEICRYCKYNKSRCNECRNNRKENRLKRNKKKFIQKKENNKSTYIVRSKKLLEYGIYEYSTYLLTDHWSIINIEARKRSKVCLACKKPGKLDVHHLKYDNIMTMKELNDVILLCTKCHNYVHKYARILDISVNDATNMVIIKKSK